MNSLNHLSCHRRNFSPSSLFLANCRWTIKIGVKNEDQPPWLLCLLNFSSCSWITSLNAFTMGIWGLGPSMLDVPGGNKWKSCTCVRWWWLLKRKQPPAMVRQISHVPSVISSLVLSNLYHCEGLRRVTSGIAIRKSNCKNKALKINATAELLSQWIKSFKCKQGTSCAFLSQSPVSPSKD